MTTVYVVEVADDDWNWTRGVYSSWEKAAERAKDIRAFEDLAPDKAVVVTEYVLDQDCEEEEF